MRSWVTVPASTVDQAGLLRPIRVALSSMSGVLLLQHDSTTSTCFPHFQPLRQPIKTVLWPPCTALPFLVAHTLDPDILAFIKGCHCEHYRHYRILTMIPQAQALWDA